MTHGKDTAVATQQIDRHELTELGQQLRVDAVRCSAAAGSGHPTSSMSAADLMAVLLARHLRLNFDAPETDSNDRLIFSKGHASPLLCAMFAASGAITDAELLSFRAAGSRLEGHPTPRLPWVDAATGSLGQGLPIGVGMALAGQYDKGGEMATRTAYGEALAALGDSRPDVVAIDGDVGDSTRAEYFQKAHPERPVLHRRIRLPTSSPRWPTAPASAICVLPVAIRR